MFPWNRSHNKNIRCMLLSITLGLSSLLPHHSSEIDPISSTLMKLNKKCHWRISMLSSLSVADFLQSTENSSFFSRKVCKVKELPKFKFQHFLLLTKIFTMQTHVFFFLFFFLSLSNIFHLFNSISNSKNVSFCIRWNNIYVHSHMLHWT